MSISLLASSNSEQSNGCPPKVCTLVRVGSCRSCTARVIDGATAAVGGTGAVRMKGKSRRNDYVANAYNPTWRYYADMATKVDTGDLLTVEVWDYDQLSVDDLVGVALVEVAALSKEPQEFKLILASDLDSAGKLDPPLKTLGEGMNEGLQMGGQGELAYRKIFDRAEWRTCLAEKHEPSVALRRIDCGTGFQRPQAISLFLLRHGQSVWNRAQASLDWFTMWSECDHPLSSGGILECSDFNSKLRQEAAKAEDACPHVKLLMEADEIVSSPLTRAVQTAMIGFAGHPAMDPSKPGPHLTLQASAREIKKLGSKDCVGDAVGKDVMVRAANCLEAHGGAEVMHRYTQGIEADCLDSVDEWWTVYGDEDDDQDMQRRYYEFLSCLRWGKAADGAGQLKPTAVAGHSNFIRRFCKTFMDPELLQTSEFARRLTVEKLHNAHCVRLDIEFDHTLENEARVVGAYPLCDGKLSGFKDEMDIEDLAAMQNTCGWLNCCSFFSITKAVVTHGARAIGALEDLPHHDVATHVRESMTDEEVRQALQKIDVGDEPEAHWSNLDPANLNQKQRRRLQRAIFSNHRDCNGPQLPSVRSSMRINAKSQRAVMSSPSYQHMVSGKVYDSNSALEHDTISNPMFE